MKEKIKLSVKTYSSKYGLKDASMEKIANLVEQRLLARGEIAPEQMDSIIEEEVKACEPFMAMIQSEADSRQQRNTEPTPIPQANPNPNPASQIDVDALISRLQEGYTNSLATAMKPLQDKIFAMESEKSRNTMFSNVRTAFNEKYKNVRFSERQKGFLEDAWELAASNVSENTKQEDLLKAYEDRFNKSCSLAGDLVIFPTEGDGGKGDSKTDYQKLVDSVMPQEEDTSAYKSHFGIQ